MDMCSREINERLSSENVEIFVRIFVLLYADDTIIMAESPEELQNALDMVKEYCDAWKLQINVTKTKVVNKQVMQARRALFSMLTKCKKLELPIDQNCDIT